MECEKLLDSSRNGNYLNIIRLPSVLLIINNLRIIVQIIIGKNNSLLDYTRIYNWENFLNTFFYVNINLLGR